MIFRSVVPQSGPKPNKDVSKDDPNHYLGPSMKDIVDKQQASTAKNLVSHEDDKDAVIKKRLQNLKEKPGFNQHKEYF